MTNLIEKVAELRELEEKATPGKWYYWMVDGTDFTAIATIPKPSCCDTASAHEVIGSSEWLRAEPDDMNAIVALRNAAPKLLDVLSKIQAGDAKRLAGLIRWQTINDECSQDEIDMLDRLHEMACKMEANHE